MTRVLCLTGAVLLSLPTCARAQATTPTAPPDPSAAAQPERSDPDVLVDPVQPDFNLTTLPTTLRLARHKLAFRVTHRFTRPLGQGDFSDLLGDGFGIDGSAQVGLELRYGLLSGTQIGIHRTSDRTIEIFGQHNFLKEKEGTPLGLDIIATLEGENNLRDHHQTALGAIVSKNVKRYAALYVEPLVVINSNPLDVGDSSTAMIGFGGRVRIRPAMYLVGEITPRLSGYDPGTTQGGFGVEFRAGGHLFQINFSNGFGTTLGQVARGGFGNDNWFLGFNISRKFF
jgi:hypothetical protein